MGYHHQSFISFLDADIVDFIVTKLNDKNNHSEKDNEFFNLDTHVCVLNLSSFCTEYANCV